jgi:HlyD family secretion protein
MPKGNKKSKKKVIVFSIMGALILIIIALIIFKGNKTEITTVQTEKVSRRTITKVVTATGKIDAEFKVAITPEVTGEIVSLPVKEGEHVKKGALLLKIKADSYLATKQKAEATLQSAKADVAQRKAELDKVSSDYKRMSELHAKKLASDADLENANSLYLSSKAQYESAQSYVVQNQASLKETLESLYKTTISSPLEGTVTKLNVELGERVLGSGFSQGTDIMTVSDLSKMEAIVDVDENDIVTVKIGDTARVTVDAFGDKKFVGFVTEIGNSAITTSSGTQNEVTNFQVKIKIFDPDQKLRPGMSCTANIETETKSNVLSVPIPSVTARLENKVEEKTDNTSTSTTTVAKKKEKPDEIVFLVQGGKAKTRVVKTGISDDNYIEVQEGLQGGEEVVSGSYKAISRDLNDGAVIKVENKGSGKSNDKK